MRAGRRLPRAAVPRRRHRRRTSSIGCERRRRRPRFCGGRATPAPGLVKARSLKTGLCTTGNSLDCSPTDAPIIEESGAVCKDMEAASLAHAAELSGTPFLAIKVVTDIVDGPHATQDEFLANLSTASKALQKVLPEVLDYVTGKSVAEL